MDKKRKNQYKKIYPILILVATFFMSIGYASVNSVLLGIDGSIDANLPDGIYITDVNYDSSVAADYENSNIIYAHQTMLNSEVILSNTDINSSITYKVTIYNSEANDYVFNGANYLESEETYSNDGITFKLNGLSSGYILKSKQSVTFTITFSYNSNAALENNTLKSLLNFDFDKIYYVTYENFSSTSNYPQYVVEGKTLTVSFGTLDAPIEVKQSGVVLGSSAYTYSNYKLTLKKVSGKVHIRKLTKYTITNLVKNGSFESGLTNWSIIGSSTSWHETSIFHFGAKAVYRDASSQGINYIQQKLSFTKGHKYYFFAYAICTSEQQFFADIATKSGSEITFKAIPTSYKRGSVVYTANFTGTNAINVNFAATTDSVIVDGVGMVDLTAAFGSGKEPSKSWCDSNIKYFDSSTVVYK